MPTFALKTATKLGAPSGGISCHLIRTKEPTCTEDCRSPISTDKISADKQWTKETICHHMILPRMARQVEGSLKAVPMPFEEVKNSRNGLEGYISTDSLGIITDASTSSSLFTVSIFNFLRGSSPEPFFSRRAASEPSDLSSRSITSAERLCPSANKDHEAHFALKCSFP